MPKVRYDDEIWKDIIGYEGLYQVSNLGRIKSFDRKANTFWGNRIIKGKILTPQYDKDGYKRIGLVKNKKQKHFYVHRIVAQVFIPNPNNYPVINHKNEIKDDNNINNLEWCTVQYNCLYNNSIYNHLIKKKYKKVCQYDLLGNFIQEWNSIKEASKKLNIVHSSISLCCKGKYKRAGGFIWKYKEI